MGSGKRLTIRVEPSQSDIPVAKLEEAANRLVDTVKFRISITPAVEISAIGDLPRFEGKARRVIRED